MQEPSGQYLADLIENSERVRQLEDENERLRTRLQMAIGRLEAMVYFWQLAQAEREHNQSAMNEIETEKLTEAYALIEKLTEQPPNR